MNERTDNTEEGKKEERVKELLTTIWTRLKNDNFLEDTDTKEMSVMEGEVKELCGLIDGFSPTIAVKYEKYLKKIVERLADYQKDLETKRQKLQQELDNIEGSGEEFVPVFDDKNAEVIEDATVINRTAEDEKPEGGDDDDTISI